MAWGNLNCACAYQLFSASSGNNVVNLELV